MFRKILTTIASVVTALLVFTGEVSAQAIQIPNPVVFTRLEDFVNFLFTGIVRQIIVFAFVGLILYGGWVRMTARDDAKKIEDSTKIIVAAAVGFGIIVLAPVLVEFLGALIGVQGNVIS